MHPVTTRIAEAIDLLERHGQPVTPSAVEINVRSHLTFGDWPPDEPIHEALMERIRRYMRNHGYVITDDATRVRKDYWTTSLDELRVQLRINKESSRFDLNRIKADEAVLRLLEEKEGELGYAPYPALFEDEIRRIYAMHAVEAPGRRRD